MIHSAVDTSHRILFVDNQPKRRAVVRRMLQSRGHLVTACSRYEDARRMLLGQAFEVLLTEIRLGAFNGLQLAILGKDLCPDLQVVVFSAYDDPVLRDEAERLGGRYVSKQLIPERLLQAVQRQNAA